eukprot:scaffold15362_cov72-Phaeocystis_antarctica.AAC.4
MCTAVCGMWQGYTCACRVGGGAAAAVRKVRVGTQSIGKREDIHRPDKENSGLALLGGWPDLAQSHQGLPQVTPSATVPNRAVTASLRRYYLRLMAAPTAACWPPPIGARAAWC